MLMFLYHVLFLHLKMNIMPKYITPRKTLKSYIKNTWMFICYILLPIV